MKSINRKLGGYTGIVFDLDGVLLDSLDNMRESWNAIPASLRNFVSFTSFKEIIGLPFQDAMRRLGLDENSLKIESIYQTNTLKFKSLFRPFPGVSEILTQLKKSSYHLTLFTSKDLYRTNLINENFGWNFDITLCPNPKLAGKPSSDQLWDMMNKTSSSPSDHIYFGDSEADFISAVGANMEYRHCLWGYSSPPANLTPEKIINSPQDIWQALSFSH